MLYVHLVKCACKVFNFVGDLAFVMPVGIVEFRKWELSGLTSLLGRLKFNQETGSY